MGEVKTRTFGEKLSFLFDKMIPELFRGRIKWFVLINTVSGALPPLISITAVKYILDMAAKESASARNIIIAAFTYTLLYILFNVLNRLMTKTADNIFVRSRMRFLGGLIKKVTVMDYELYENPEEMMKVEQSFNGVASDELGYQKILNLLFSLQPDILLTIIFSCLLLRYSPVIVLTVLVSLLINFIISTGYSGFVNKNRDDVDREARKIGAYTKITKDFSYGKDARVYKLGKSIISNIYRFINNYIEVKGREFVFKFKLSFLENFTISLSDLLCFSILTYLASVGKIAVSDLVMLLGMIVVFTSVIHKIKEDISTIYTQTPYVMDTYEFKDRDLNLNKNGKNIKFKGPVDISFKNVSYKYPGSENYVFKDLSFDISAGKRMALVGVNGAGKTTIVKLMTGLAKPAGGEILINDINIKELSDKSIFDLYSVVFQETEPLALTAAENIVGIEEGINFEKVEIVLKAVGLWDKISSLEKSYNSNILKVLYDDGVILSGGENQKLMIARALYKEDTSVMIMDEPTAALDAFAEEKIYREFDSYMGNKTGVFISHRLASTRFCDEILFLDGGRIAAKGSHEELLKSCEEYRAMFETQGKYYKVDENEQI